jgi:hypothetical protein
MGYAADAVVIPPPDVADLRVGELALVVVVDRALDELVNQRGRPGSRAADDELIAAAQSARGGGQDLGEPPGEVVLSAGGLRDCGDGLGGVR